MSLTISFLLFFIFDFHISNFPLQFLHLVFKFLGLAFQCADLILHIFLFLLSLQCLSHSESN